jgi:hypothetical protein
MSELGSHLAFSRVNREHVSMELVRGFNLLGAELPAGEANNFTYAVVERQSAGQQFRAEQIRAFGVLRPGDNSYTAEVGITVDPKLNGERAKVESELVTRLARIATGKYAHLAVSYVEKVGENEKTGKPEYRKTFLRTVDL